MRRTQPRRAAAAVALFAITFYLPQVCYQVLWALQTSHQSLRTFPEAFATWPTIYWLVDFGLFLATFAAVAATVAVKSGVDAQQERQRLDAENLSRAWPWSGIDSMPCGRNSNRTSCSTR